ncbi:MAG TPA: 4-hydroxy-tetrahydrodipicolinate reductase, partial [Gemmatales bacterium]|nr:4-hydroxy-tetrahydrodipicolinate reductase [Gemmatales bacterium]
GHSDAELDEIRAAAHQTAILKAQNLSLGMNVLAELVHRAAALMRGQPVDVEIVERHHRGKKEAPGLGTLRLAEIVEQQMGHYTRRHGRSGSQSERPPQELGIHSLRAGDAAGEHLVLLAGLGETLELKHTVSSRDAFVRGALQAARFLVAQAPGWYEMSDVLGL